MSEQSIFLTVLDLNETERAAYLEQVCAGNESLRREVEALLKAHERSGTFLNEPAIQQIVNKAPGVDQNTVTASADGNGTDENTRTAATGQPSAGVDDSLLFLKPPTRPGSIGRLDHYEVLEKVGAGGFGTVLKVFDDRLHRVVAMKVLAPQLAASGTARARFIREARSAAAVKSEHIVGIHAIDEGAHPYLVMEFVSGQTLQQKLDSTGPLGVKEILRIGHQIAAGLAAAHATGLVHRDIKPANVLLENGIERVKITDFGLARAADDASISQSGVVAGTPTYMAPEQARGEHVDHRADLFSLGSVMYAMCTGRPPFRASTTMATLKRVCDDTPRPIREINPEIPEWLEAIVAKLHAKNPGDRFQTAKEVARLLQQHLAHLQQPNVTPLPPSVVVPSESQRFKEVPAPAERPTATASPRRQFRLAAILLVVVGLPLVLVPVLFFAGYWLIHPSAWIGLGVVVAGLVAYLLSVVVQMPNQQTPVSPPSIAASDDQPLPAAPTSTQSQGFMAFLLRAALTVAGVGFAVQVIVLAYLFTRGRLYELSIAAAVAGLGLAVLVAIAWHLRNRIRVRPAGQSRPTVEARPSPRRSPWLWRNWKWATTGVLLLIVSAFAARSQTVHNQVYSLFGYGTVLVDLADPNMTVVATDVQDVRHGRGIHRFRLKAGTHHFTAWSGGGERLKYFEVDVVRGNYEYVAITVLDLYPRDQSPDAEGFVQLFNGKDLRGWQTAFGDNNSWQVRDGAIVGSGQYQCLRTDKLAYKNFHFRVQVKTNAGGDSGVYLRGPIGFPDGVIQAQILNGVLENGTGTLFRETTRIGSSATPYDIPPDTWFTLEVIAQGNRIETRVNGRLAAQAFDEKMLGGPIALESFNRDTVVHFRKIEIKELPELESDPEATIVFPNPITLNPYANQIGKNYRFDVVGSVDGPLWGTGLYSTDSALAAAAVHGGFLKPGQRGIVQVSILPAGNDFKGSIANGVTSAPWNYHPASFRINRLIRLLDPGTSPAQEDLESKLKQIGVAMHSYYSAHEQFPTPANYDKKGTALLSWRVHLLPHLGHEDLYKQFKLDEPWDSAHNRPLVAKIPLAFDVGAADGKTSIVVPVGADTIFPGVKTIKLQDLVNGAANTVLILECAKAQQVIWTKPDDWPLNPYQPSQGLPEEFWVVRADGSVFQLSSKLPANALRSAFTRLGEAPHKDIWTTPTAPTMPDAGTLVAFQNQVDKTLSFVVVGSVDGSVWGTDVYTADSRLSTAAVHAGFLKAGQRGTLRVKILPAQQAYTGTPRNGVTSSNYAAFPASYRILGVSDTSDPSFPIFAGAVSAYRGQIGKTFEVEVVGNQHPSCWGTDIYSDDSDLGTAAVHAGLVKLGEKGRVKVTILAGQTSYTGTTRNGVTTNNYPQFPGSFKLEAAPPIAVVETGLKSAFLYQFFKYVEWPKGAVPKDDEFVLGILGDDPLANHFINAARETIQGKRIRVLRLATADQIEPCHILYVADEPKLVAALAKLKTAPTLVVSHGPGLAQKGSMINLYGAGNNIRFEINEAAAKKAGLKIDDRLLALHRADPSSLDENWVKLFNGKDLKGWQQLEEQPGKWQVVDGVLIGSEAPGQLFTDGDNYQNFHLRAEVALSKGSNSDIYFRSKKQPPGPAGSPRSPAGYAVSLAEGLDRHTGPISFLNPKGVWTTQGGNSTVKPDEWFKLEIIANGNRLVTKVNDVLVVDFVEALDTHKKGRIGLRMWEPNTVIRFRKIDIKELPDSQRTPGEIAFEETAKLTGEWVLARGAADEQPLTAEAIAQMKLTLLNNRRFVLPIRDDSGYPFAATGDFDLDIAKKQLTFKIKGLDEPSICTYRVDGDKLVLDFPEPKLGKAETGSTELFTPDERSASQRNLKKLGIAMHQGDAFPPAAITSAKDGKPLLSWRVAILPHLEQEALYKQFKLDEPWDSEHNKKLIDKMPRVFTTPGVAAKPGHTHYRVFVGPGTLFEPQRTGAKGVGFADAIDGLANTILVAEAADAVEWTKPDDLPYDPKQPLPKLGVYRGGAHVLMGDGSVWRLSPDATEKGIRGAIVRNDEQAISPQLLQRIPWRGPALHLEFRRVVRAASPQVPRTASEVLPFFAGTWKTERVQIEPKRPPEQAREVGESTYEFVADGKFLRARGSNGEREVILVYSFDAATDKLHCWFALASRTPSGPAAGVFDATKRTLQWLERIPNGNLIFHEYTLVDSNTITTRLYQQDAKNKIVSEVQMKFNRIPGPIALPNLPVDPKRPEEMKVLDRLVGEWKHDLTVTESGKQKVEKSGSVAKPILQGHMVEVFESNETRKTNDYWLTWFDAFAKQYRTWYFAGDGTASDFTGTWDEANKTMSWKSLDNTVDGKWIFKSDDVREMPMTVNDKAGNVRMESTGVSRRIKSDTDRFLGAWRATDVQSVGKAMTPELIRTLRFQFDGNKVSYTHEGRAPISGVFTLDPSKDPKEITVKPAVDSTVSIEGIYKFDADKLVLCMPMFGIPKPRAKKFELDPTDPARAIMTFVRETVPPKAANADELKALRDLVAANERAFANVKINYDVGRVSKIEFNQSKADVVEAKARLAQAEGDRAAVAVHGSELLSLWKEERTLIASRVDAGVDAPVVLDKFDARIAEAKVRLTKGGVDLTLEAGPKPRESK